MVTAAALSWCRAIVGPTMAYCVVSKEMPPEMFRSPKVLIYVSYQPLEALPNNLRRNIYGESNINVVQRGVQ